ncbi:MAG TPA: site-specific integrase [Ktedonobacteraceae bacterium]
MAKRGNNEGSIYQRKEDGRWVGSITLPDGKRRVFYGKKKSEVIDKIGEALHDLRRGMLPTSSNATLQEYIEQWLEEVHKDTIKLKTYTDYQGLLRNYIIPGLGTIKLQSLTPQQIQAFYAKKLREGFAPKTVKNIHVLLHKSLSDAVKWNVLSRNVCDAVTPPRLSRKEHTVLTPEQAHILIKQIKGHSFEALLTLALVTGMRCGELLALHWSDIDFTNCSLQVRRTVGHFKDLGYVESEPKTAKSRRQIKLPLFVVEALMKHKAQQDEQRNKKASEWIDRNLVFTGNEGNYISLTTLRKTFNNVLKQAGLPHMRFHDLRHSAATIMLSKGTHPKVVQEILGHSQVNITMDVYSHVLPSMQEDVTKRWDDDFGAPASVK